MGVTLADEPWRTQTVCPLGARLITSWAAHVQEHMLRA